MDQAGFLRRTTRSRSWLRVVNDAIDVAPGPAWSTYLAIGLGLALVVHLGRWIDGGWPVGWIHPSLSFASSTPAIYLAAVAVLDRAAAKALDRLRPVLTLDDASVEELRFRLTAISPVATAVIVLISVPVAAMSLVNAPASYLLEPDAGPISWWTTVLDTGLAGAIVFTFMFQTFERLRLIDKVHRRMVRVDLFQLQPLYAFATLTAWTAIALVGLTLIGFIMLFGNAATIILGGVDAAIFVTVYVLAVATFALPLLSLHERIVDEKDRRLGEASAALDTAIRRAHAQIRDGELASVGASKDSVEVANAALAAISRVSTWPWRAGTLRGFLGAVGLPVLIWLVTTVLARVLPG